MASSRLVVVHNNIDSHSSIGKLASWALRTALEAGYEVVAVAKDLDPAYQKDVQYVPLHVPPAVFAYQWARALGTVKSALDSVEFDIMHTYQAQLTGLADTWHVEFLTRTAKNAGSFPAGRDPLSIWRRNQLRVVARMEDRYLKKISDRIKVLFPSTLMRDEFARLYGRPSRHVILPNPAPEQTLLSAERRADARHRLVGAFDGIVVGFLGGLDDRKGWRSLIDGMANTPSAFLLFGGTGSEGFNDDRLRGRLRSVGYVNDVSDFLAACDVIAAPSLYDPFAMVVTDAAAHGVPSITTPLVGVQDQVRRYGAGVFWDGAPASFPKAVGAVAMQHKQLVSGATKMAAALSERQLASVLLAAWDDALSHRRTRHAPASA